MINIYTTKRGRIPAKGLFSALTFATLLFWAGAAHGQLAMTRTTFTGSFAAITSVSGGTLATATGDDVTQDGLPIGFTFNYLGTNYTTMGVSTNGWASFLTLAGASQNANTNLYNTTGPQLSLGPWWDDLASDSIVYQTTGAAGSMVFTIQWNAKTYFTGATQLVKFQLKLYETTNVIEFHYGPVTAGTASASESASIGIEGATGGAGNYLDAVCGSAFVGHYYMQAATKWPVRFYRFTPGAPTAVPGGAYTVGTAGAYPTIDEAVADLNHRGVSGAVVLALTQANYDVTPANGDNIFPVLFGPIAGTSAANTVVMAPLSGTSTITYEGSAGGGFANGVTTAAAGTTNEPIIGFIGSKYVGIQNLNLACSATGVVDRGVSMLNQSAAGTGSPNFGGTQFCAVQGVNVTLSRTNTSSMGFETRLPTTPSALTGSNASNAFLNFNISNTYFGILLSGNATWADIGNVIGNTVATNFNTIGAATANDIGNGTLTTYGIQCLNQNGVSVYNNIIRNITVNGAVAVDGIYMNATQGTSSVYNNKISNIKCTSTTSTSNINGIRANVAATGTHTLRVYNNFVSALSSGYTGAGVATRVIRGIYAQAAGSGTATSSINIDFNSVSIDGSTSPNVSSTCFEIGTTSGPVMNVRNNIFANWTGAQTAPSLHLAWHSTSATLTGNTGSVSNYNDLYVSNSTQGFTGQGNVTQYATLANWQAAMTQDANSVSCDPGFTNPSSDLHASAVCVNDVGTTLAWVTTDIDNTVRGGTPDMGADEFTPPTLDVGISMQVAPVSGNCYTSTEPVTVRVRNFAVATLDFSVTTVQITVNITGAVTTTLNYTIPGATPSVPAGGTVDITIGNFNMSAAGTYIFNGYTSVTAGGPDQNAANDAMSQVSINYSPGVNSPGGRNICAGGAIPVALTNSGATNSGSLQWQSSTDGGLTWVNETGPGSTTSSYSVLPLDSTWYRVIMCGSLVTNIDTVNVIPTTPPTVQGDTVCGQGFVDLIATGPGQKDWFTAAVGGTSIYTGDTLNTYVTATTPFYVSAGSGGGVENCGLVNNSAGGGQQTSTAYNIFDVTQSCELTGVYVYPGAAGNCLLELRNSAGVLVAGPWTFTATAGDVGVKTWFPIGYQLQIGTAWRLAQATGSVSMFRNSAGVTYPYCTPSNAVCQTGSSAGASFYYFAYDWVITTGCASSRVQVDAVVTPADAIVATPDSTMICENDSLGLTASSVNGSYVYTWTPGITLTDSTIATPTAVPSENTQYIVMGIDSAGCVAGDTITVFVNSAPNGSLWVSDSATICINSLDSVGIAFIYPDDSFYVAGAMPILDPPALAQFDTLIVANGPAVLSGPIGGIKRVCLDITHTWDSDMNISLISPNGTTIDLSSGNGGSGDNFTGTCFDMNAATPVTAGVSPFLGSYIPEGNFANFAGEDPNGIWQISIQDLFGGDIGTLNWWYIVFDVPAVDLSWTSDPAGFSSTSDSIWVAPDTTTSYIATVTDSLTGCAEVFVYTVNVYPEITAAITSSASATNVCAGTAITLYSNGAGGNGALSYDWNGLGSLDSLSVTVSSDTMFIVNIVDTCTTPMASDTIWFTIADSLGLSVSADTTICEGSSATLTAAGILGDLNYTYSWSNGDTTASTTVSPVTLTTYTVTVTDGCGNSVTDQVVVTVDPLPNAGFTFAPASPQAGQVVTFTNTSTNSTAWTWDFGDGSPTSGTQNPTHTYSTANNYTVTLIATNSCGSDTTTQTITILTGIAEALDGGEVKMFPNPNNGQFNVQLSQLSGKAVNIEVSDLRGVSVFSREYQVNSAVFTETVDIRNFSKGVYFVKLSSGNSVAVGKIIVE